ncbi:MAG: MmgE/PrpD family protein [Deltaproteobacteria bacterium]|nr:MmgE/PrpD family protein [Deltaproteobacteria bacterium]
MNQVSEGKSVSDVLAEFLIREKYEALPSETIKKVKEYILDVIGCSIGASQQPQVKILAEVMNMEGGNPHSSVIARGIKTSMMNAAMINGTMGHSFDFDDDHREGTMHPSVAVFPAVFAMGEKLGITGKELMRSFILGLEVMIRLGESLLGKSYYQGFHPTGTCGVFGAAAACATAMGLDLLRTKYALGIAASFSAGTFECTGDGAWQKPLQAGHPAMGGVLAALLAEKSYRGSGTVLDGPNGLIRAFSFKDQYDYGRITDTLGKKWEMMDTSIKVHACCRFSSPVADCALDLYRQGVRAKNVKNILAKVGDFSIRALCNPEDRKRKPETHVDAQFSLPWAIAVAVCKNRTGIDEFKVESLGDPDVLELAQKVTWEMDPEAEAMYPKAYPATLVAEMTDGRIFEAHVDFPKGDPENPASKDEILTKFHALTEKFIDQDRREKIIETVDNLHEVTNISDLADLVR